MPKRTSNQDFNRFESLLEVAREDEGEIAGVTPLREALERAHCQALFLRCLRDAMQSTTMDATRKLNKALADGQEAAICLRSYVRGKLGTKSEKLVRYGIKPRGRRGARTGR